MTTSEELAQVAIWMMGGGGVVTLFAMAAILMSSGAGVDRGDLAKPLGLVGLGTFLLGAYLNYRWGTYW